MSKNPTDINRAAQLHEHFCFAWYHLAYSMLSCFQFSGLAKASKEVGE